MKLFPHCQADPSSKCRPIDIFDLLASAYYLLRYAESDLSFLPTEEHPNGVMYYPLFAEHERFSIWIVDCLRRPRALTQSQVY